MPRYHRLILFFIRMVFLFIPLFILILLAYKNFVPSGRLQAFYDFKKRTPFITVLRPQGRISEPLNEEGDTFQTIIDQPVYFDVRLPRIFDKVKLKLKYQNIDQSLIEIGALTNKEKWIFDLKPLDNSVINSLYKNNSWQIIKDGDVVLFQKNGKFKSRDEFLANPPPYTEIATYNYILNQEYKISNYKPKKTRTILNQSFRQTQRMYTYIKDEDLDFIFSLQDLNQYQGDDTMTVQVYFKDDILFNQDIKIDNNTTADAKLSDIQEFKVRLENVKEGLYKIDLLTPSDDIIVRKIDTAQHLFVFRDTLYLIKPNISSEDVESKNSKKLQIYTNGNIVYAQTRSALGLQKILTNKQEYPISETHKKIKLMLPFGIKPVVVEDKELILQTKGVFSFSLDNFFNPEPQTLTHDLDFNQDNFQYVVAQYREPQQEGLWKTQEAEFDVNKLYTKERKIYFVISMPYKESDQKGMKLTEIQVDFIGKPYTWQDIKSKFKDLKSVLFSL